MPRVGRRAELSEQADLHHSEALGSDFTLCLQPERFRLCHHYVHQGMLCLPLIGLIALLIWTALESFSNENHHVLIWHQKLTCLLAFEAAWKGEEALLVITGAEPRRAVHVQLPSNSLEITVLLQWLLMRTNCTTIELPWTLKMNGHCGNLLMGRENPIYLWNRGNASKGWEGLI